MVSLSEVETFRERLMNLLSILASLGLITNLIFVCFVWSRKNLREHLIIITILIVNDILSGIRYLIYAQWPSLRVTNDIYCKSLTFVSIIPENLESILLVTFLIVFTIRPEIKKTSSAIIILITLCVITMRAIPETLDAAMKEDDDGTKRCYSDLSENEILTFISFLTLVILPVVVLIGFFFMQICERNLNHEILKKSQDIKLLKMMMTIFVVLVGPSLIFNQYFDEIYTFFRIEYFIVVEKIVSTLSILNVVYKPFLIYNMNEYVKTEIENLFRSARDSRSVTLDLQDKDNITEMNKCKDDEIIP